MPRQDCAYCFNTHTRDENPTLHYVAKDPISKWKSVNHKRKITKQTDRNFSEDIITGMKYY